jgi:protein-serine/threonine kinase
VHARVTSPGPRRKPFLHSETSTSSKPPYQADMDPNNRLRLNFGGIAEGNYAASNDRSMYPTTPSTFPQPIFQNQSTQQDYLGSRLTSPTTGFGQGYFMNNTFALQAQQPQQQTQYSTQQYQQPTQQTLQSPQASYQPRSANIANDGTNSLIHQFSNQDLGGGRNMFSRTPSPAVTTSTQRPRTAGSTGQQGGQGPYSSHLAPPMPSRSSRQEIEEDPPERNPDKYSKNIYARGKVINNLVREVFEANVVRARERNTR